ncbi:MAG: ATPase, partial [Sulfitobacter sp.]|nr:ATPase [Sulfitobacter sp.]
RVVPQHGAVADMLAAYGDSDLLCYRAERPEELVARQRAHWDPLLDWAAETLGARLVPVEGVMHAPQDPEALARLRARAHDQSAFELAAFHDLVSLSGSLIIGFAVTHGHQEPESLWNISRLDEAWQAEQWGKDEEAEAMAAIKRESFLHGARMFALCRPSA